MARDLDTFLNFANQWAFDHDQTTEEALEDPMFLAYWNNYELAIATGNKVQKIETMRDLGWIEPEQAAAWIESEIGAGG